MNYLLIAVAAIGHVILWAVIVNRLHGLGIERRWIDVATAACGLALAAIPLALAFVVWSRPHHGRVFTAAWSYIYFSAACCLLAAVHRLWFTLHPERRGILQSNHTTRLDLGRHDRERLTAPGIPR